LPDGGNRAELCRARGLADARSSLPASKWARSRENERPPWNAPRRRQVTSRRERTVWTVISEPTSPPTILHLVASRRETSAIPSVERTEVRSETLPACGPNDPVNEVNGTSAPGVSRRRHPSVTLVVPGPGHCHEPGDLVPPDVVVGFRQKGAYKRAQPEESEDGSGPRPRFPSRRVPARCRVVGALRHQRLRPMGAVEFVVL